MRSSALSAILRVFLLTTLAFALASPLLAPNGLAPLCLASEGKKPAEPKRGILLVAFGTSVPEAATAIDALRQGAEAAFPGVPVRLAYSSKIIRDKIAGENPGSGKRSPAQALADMAAEGFTHVAVQSLHAIPGREYSDIKATAEAYKAMPKGIPHISIGRPLLYGHEDIAKAAEAILKSLAPRKRGRPCCSWATAPRTRPTPPTPPCSWPCGSTTRMSSSPRWRTPPAWTR